MNLAEIFKIIDKIAKKQATPVYTVGGFVRDLLLGIEQKKDIDFVVVGSGLEFAREFDKKMKEEGSLVEFPDFDTARYIIMDNDEELVLEFAGARSESYRDTSRKPTVTPATLSDDLSRRDFTINAMATEVNNFVFTKDKINFKDKKKLIDLFAGQIDLREKTLRTPLSPDQTFIDDPLRMMRAIRFAGQLNFSIDSTALNSIHENADRLKIISGERIQEELLKMLAIEQPSVCLTLMFQTGLLDYVLPEVSKLDGVEEIYGHQHKNNLIHTFKVVDNIASKSDKILLRLAGLLHDIGKPRTKEFVPKIGWTFHQHEHYGKKLVFDVTNRLHFSKADAKYLGELVRWHQQPISLMDKGITDSAVRRLVVNLKDNLEDLLILGSSDITTGNPDKLKKRLKNYDKLRERIDEVLEKDKLREFQSPVRGEEIMKECGLKAGPVVGKIKKAIEEAILDGKIPNEYEAAREYFMEIKDKYIK
jgi:tRNA nucleotidyltransferase/poly(A) polymerase